MQITLLMIGKNSDRFIEEGFAHFESRLVHYIRFQARVIPDLKDRRNLSPEQIMDREGDLILQQLSPEAVTVLLDEHGRGYRSVDFAAYLQKQMNSGCRELVFIIGGAYGTAEKVKQKVNHRLSLSQLTFTHQFIRLMLMEQLYRAMTILRNEPYHNE